MQLDVLDGIPVALVDTQLRDIRRLFPNPSLVRVAGKRTQPLFISTLLHGDETTSFSVLQELARRVREEDLPRSLLILIGNVRAAEAGARFLSDQADFNRIWSGNGTPFHDLAGRVLSAAREARPFASIDIHNNTGANPLYGCVSSLRPADLQLAAMFSNIGVHYRIPETTLSVAFSDLCPSLTIECGRSGEAEGCVRASALVRNVMTLEHFPDEPPDAKALSLYETLGRVVIDSDCDFAFAEAGAQLLLRRDLEALNFVSVPAGETWARFSGNHPPLRVLDAHGGDISGRFFVIDGSRIALKRAVTPAMATSNKTAIRQDCVCYFMEPLQRT
jgi:hypothetical protein